MQAQASHYRTHGFAVCPAALTSSSLAQVRAELLGVGGRLLAAQAPDDLDALWAALCARSRQLGGALYNAFKLLPSVHQLSCAPELTAALRQVTGMQLPGVVDINCRIDAFGETKYLFDWHQDYWFSKCSPAAVVAWIPLLSLHEGRGGLDVVSLEQTERRILKVRPGERYDSYADAVLLNEPVAHLQSQALTDMASGDLLLFGFDVLHRSRAVTRAGRARFTIQIRFADFADGEFMHEQFRPGRVAPGDVDFLKDRTPP